MGWLSGWAYRRAITITEQSGSTLTDYQVKIELNSSNFDFSKANSDGSDIRFTEDDGTTLLSYWIEKWDSSNEEAIIWVKVPSLPANESVTIYLYYGNSGAESESDANAVFDFYDDFDTLSTNWQDIGQTAWEIKEAIDGELHLKSGTATGKRLLAYNGYTFTDGVIEARINAVNRAPAVAYRIVDKANYYRSRINVDTDFMSIDRVSDDTVTKLANYDISLVPQYYRHITKVNGSSIVFDLYDDDGSLIHSLSASDTTHDSGKIGFWGYGDSTGGSTELYVDWVRVRKYAEQEPSINVGSEEVAIFTISGTVKLPDGTPIEGATVISIREDTFEIFDTTTSGSDGSYTLNGFINSGNTVIVIPPSSDQNGDIKCHIQSE